MTDERAEIYPLRRREVVARLVAERGELLVVGGLGAPSWDLTAAGDHALTFPLWGAMGGAAMIGLGLALAQPTRRVLEVTGDVDRAEQLERHRERIEGMMDKVGVLEAPSELVLIEGETDYLSVRHRG